MVLYGQIYNFMVPVNFSPGKIEICLDPAADRTAPGKMKQLLSGWTGMNWIISVLPAEHKKPEHLSLAEEDVQMRKQKLENAAGHPIVKAVLETFPGARLGAVTDIANEQSTYEEMQQ